MEVNPDTFAFHSRVFLEFATRVGYVLLVMWPGNVRYIPGFSLFLFQEWKKRRIRQLQMMENRAVKVRFRSCYVKFSELMYA